VDLDVFTPGDQQRARTELGIAQDALVLLFVGRIQPLKAPDLLVRAAAEMVARDASLRSRLVVAICGGPSGTGLARPRALEELAGELGISDLVRFVPPAERNELVRWYRAATVCVVPSYSESFGLVAVEAQACGTPVIAARVGGLATTVRDGSSGLLVDGHNVADWATAIDSLVRDRNLLTVMSAGARAHAEGFGWERTVDRLLDVYREAVASSRERNT
jgi:D-inositol-3-phosphate glycosyltransferase